MVTTEELLGDNEMRERILARYLERFEKRYDTKVVATKMESPRNIIVALRSKKPGRATSALLHWTGARWSLRKVFRGGQQVTASSL